MITHGNNVIILSDIEMSQFDLFFLLAYFWAVLHPIKGSLKIEIIAFCDEFNIFDLYK